MLGVFKASGEEVLEVQFADLVDKIAAGKQHIRVLDLKRHLQSLYGEARFRQRLVLADGKLLSDDDVLSGPMDVQLILLPFSPTSNEQVQQLWKAAGDNDVAALEMLLQRPQDPSLKFARGAPLHHAAETGSVEAVSLLLQACADKDMVVFSYIYIYI